MTIEIVSTTRAREVYRTGIGCPVLDGESGKALYVDENGTLAQGEGLQVDAVTLADQGGVTETIYVRTTGSDTTGTGSLAAPYRTIGRALEDVPDMQRGKRWFIDCTGLSEVLPVTTISGKICPDGFGTDGEFGLSGYLNLIAQTTNLEDIAAGDIASETVIDARTQKVRVTVNPSPGWTVNAYQGKLLFETGGSVVGAQIVSNTANTLDVVGASFTGGLALTIRDYGATLTAPGGFGTSYPLYLSDCNAPIVIQGIAIDGVSVSGSRDVLVQGCDLGGFSFDTNIGLVEMIGCHATETFSDFLFDGSGENIFSGCYFSGANFNTTNTSKPGYVEFSSCYLAACGSLPRYDSTAGGQPSQCWGFFYVHETECAAAYRNAVNAAGIGDLLLENCTMTAVAAVVVANERALIRIANTSGTSTGTIGVVIPDGLVHVLDDTTLFRGNNAGVNDLKVGSLAQQAWLAAGAQNVIDITAGTGTLARIFKP